MDNKAVFQMKDIGFCYGKNKVLHNLSLTIEPGKFYGIVGPNGCGKTTLLDLLVRNKTPTSGMIEYLQKDIVGYTRRKLGREIALVPQEFSIHFAFTVREIVLMGRHPHIPRFSSPTIEDFTIVDKVMEKTEIGEFKDRYITELSGGEKQRVIFARALAQDTPVLIVDEGTSNMDIQHTLKILEIVTERVKRRKRTVIGTFHDLNLAAVYCDELIFMKFGRIVTQGETDQAFNERNIKDVFEVDSRIYFDRYSNSKQVAFKRRIPT